MEESKLKEIVQLYKEKKLSLGKCAVLAEMTKEDFIKYLATKGVSIFNFQNEDEILEDVKNASFNSKSMHLDIKEEDMIMRRLFIENAEALKELGDD